MLQRLRQDRETQHSASGFTLIELLIVVIILGILAGVAVFGVFQFKDDAIKSACKTDVKTVQSASEAYYAQKDGYAPSIAALVTAGYLKSAPSSDKYTVDYTAAGVVSSTSC